MAYTCSQIAGTILFNPSDVRCSCSNAGGIAFYEQYNGESLDFDKIDTKRNEIITAFKRGIAPYCCYKCNYKRKTDNCELEAAKSLQRIYISNWRHCNCGCIYCDYANVTNSVFSNEVKKSDFYDILPILKELVKNKKIDKDTEIIFLGGECTVLDEFEQIIELLAPIVEKRILIYSSGLISSPAIKKLLEQDKCMLVTSLDSGCPETYKKIKRIDGFEKVLSTIKEYKKSAGENFKHVTLKYILLPSINDNIEEIQKFIDILKALGVKNAFLEVDHREMLAKNCTKIPEHYYKLFEYFEKNADGIYTGDCPHNEQMRNKGYVF